MAADEVAIRLGLAQRLREVADSLTEVSTFRPTFGSGPQLHQVASRANALASALKAETVDRIPLDAEFAEQIREEVRRASRKIADLSDRATLMVRQERTGELRSDVVELGSRLVKLSFNDLRALGDQFGVQLRKVGMRMRLLEATRGMFRDRVVEEVSDCARELGDLAEQLSAATKAVQHGVALDERAPQAPARG